MISFLTRDVNKFATVLYKLTDSLNLFFIRDFCVMPALC